MIKFARSELLVADARVNPGQQEIRTQVADQQCHGQEHEESPGQTVEVDGERYKEYYGSASDFNKGEYKHVEGKRILEPVKGKLADTLIEMEQDVQSSISYSGGKKLMDIRKVNYVTLGGDNAGEHLLM